MEMSKMGTTVWLAKLVVSLIKILIKIHLTFEPQPTRLVLGQVALPRPRTHNPHQ